MEEQSIPVLKFDIDPTKKDSGISAISLVGQPAIESNFQFFDEAKTKKFAKVEGYEGRVHGLALRANKKILRTDENGESPYYGVFTAEVIKKLAAKFMKDQVNNEVNVDHNGKKFIDAYMVENFIIDTPTRLQDVLARGIKEAGIGDWYVQYQVDSPEVFQKVVNGEYNGFSIEANLDLYLSKINNSENNINTLMNSLFKITENFQKIVDEYKKASAPKAPAVVNQKFEVAPVKDSADQVEYSEAGKPVAIVLPDGSKQLAPAGDIPLADGNVLTVDQAGNMVSKAPAPVAPAPAVEQAAAPAVPVASGETKQEQVVAPAVPIAQEVAKLSATITDKDQTIQTLTSLVENFKAEKIEMQKAIDAINKELNDFKKVPLADPLKFNSVKSKQVDLSKMTTLERLAYQNGVQLSKAVLNNKNLNK